MMLSQCQGYDGLNRAEIEEYVDEYLELTTGDRIWMKYT